MSGPIIDPWVVWALIGIPLGVAMLALAGLVLVLTRPRVPVPLVAAVIVLLIVLVPHWLWS